MRKIFRTWYVYAIVLLCILMAVGYVVPKRVSEDKKNEYKKIHLEKALQTTIDSMGYGSDSLVRIKNFDSTDEPSAMVTLNVNNIEDVSADDQDSIKNLLLKSIIGLEKDNITITVEHTSQK